MDSELEVLIVAGPERARALGAALPGMRLSTAEDAAALGDRLRASTPDAVVADEASWISVRALADILASFGGSRPILTIAPPCAPPASVVELVREGAADVVASEGADLAEAVRRAVSRARGRGGDALTRAERLQALGELTAGITHDLNNLLAIGSTFLELARDGLDQGDPALADLDEAHGAITRATALTRHVVAFLRKERGATTLVDLNELVRSLEPLATCAVGSRIQLEIRLAPSLPPILGDASELEQVVLNLVLNARDAITGPGKILVETALRGADARATMSDAVGRRVMLRVTDDGCGMSAEIVERAFDAFFTTKERGTGLGLANVQSIVRRHRGVVRLRSEVGRGTTVEVHLPLPGRATSSMPGLRRPG
ncbi:MAG: ATP-binding protein [Sandaracinus sp.]